MTEQEALLSRRDFLHLAGPFTLGFFLSLNRSKKVAPSPVSPKEKPVPTPTATPNLPFNFEGEKIGHREKLITPEKVKISYPIYWGDRSQPEVALTFDDGFSEKSIKRVLDVLGKNNLHGTFFIVGTQFEVSPYLWQRAVKEGHQICNHTYSHPYLARLTNTQIREEISLWERKAKKTLGEEYFKRMKESFPYIRFPFGSGHRDKRVLLVVEEEGYTPIAWSQDSYNAVLKRHDLSSEPPGPIAQEVEKHTINTAQNGSIILLHFNKWDTLELEGTVKGIREKKLRIENVSGVLDYSL